MSMNVLTNLMALLTPKTAKDGAQPPLAGQMAGSPDFAALMGMPIADAAIATIPGVAIAAPIISEGAIEMAPEADAAGTPPPEQTTVVLTQQVALPVAGAKAIRNATVSANLHPAGAKPLPVVDGDPIEGEIAGKGEGESEGDTAAALPMPSVPDMQAAAVPDSAVTPPLAAPATVPAPLPKQDKGRAPIAGVRTVDATVNGAISNENSESISHIHQRNSASSVESPVASPLPNPASQNPVSAQVTVTPPVAMPSLAGRASAAAVRAEAPDTPVALPLTAAQPSPAAAAIPQAIMQAAGGQPAIVVAQAAAQGAQATDMPAAGTDAPVIGEATALLRMAAAAQAEKRGVTPGAPGFDVPKFAAMDAPASRAEAARPDADAKVADVPVSAERPVPAVHAMQSSLANAFPTVPAGTQPVTDLSATLGQHVIDMSSGGQWIDGLAKEIATLASGTGQGSFRLSPDHLGPMRVDIRQGDLGAEISLTVQTAAAESALRQDSDKLKTDAQLSAVRVHEVRVERVHNVAETARSDTASNQNAGGNNGTPAWNQGGTQTGFSQSQGQSQANAQGQGNGQQGGRKVSGGDAVLNHAGPSDQRGDDAQDGVRRARYA